MDDDSEEEYPKIFDHDQIDNSDPNQLPQKIIRKRILLWTAFTWMPIALIGILVSGILSLILGIIWGLFITPLIWQSYWFTGWIDPVTRYQQELKKEEKERRRKSKWDSTIKAEREGQQRVAELKLQMSLAKGEIAVDKFNTEARKLYESAATEESTTCTG